MRLNFAKYIGSMHSYMPSPAFGSRYALATIQHQDTIGMLTPLTPQIN